MKFKIVIPARFASTRLPGKPLLEIAGRPMIQHVHERALSAGAEQVIVATDDQRIADCVTGFGGEVCMTASDHPSGTDRIAEVVRLQGWSEQTIVVNLQGDEPGMPASLLRQVADDLDRHDDAVMTTLYAPITERQKLFDPNVVKVVTDAQGYALYFSRAPIPWHRDSFADSDPASETAMPPFPVYGHHIGLYAYRAGFFDRYIGWPPAPIEQLESLEQLRVLWNGERIHVSEALEHPGVGVDTQADLERADSLLG